MAPEADQTGNGYRQLVICALVAALFPLLAWLEAQAPTDADYTIALPSRVDGAPTAPRRERAWSPTYHGATSQVRETYRHKGTIYDVLTINYASQDQGAELIFGQNTLYDKDRWSRDHEAELPESEGFRLLPLRNRAGQPRIIAYWYIVADVPTTSDTMAKLLDIFGSVTRDTGASVVAVSVRGPYEETVGPLTTFVGRLQAQLKK